LRSARGFLLICLICGFSILFYSLLSIKNPVGGGDRQVLLRSDEDVAAETIQFSEWKGEKKIWTLNAQRGKYHHQAKKASFEEAYVTFFPPEGGKMNLWAKMVFYDIDTGDIRARGEVRGESEEGYEFLTETLFYHAEKRIIETEDKVRLQKDRLSLTGVGMRGFLEEHRFILLSSVAAQFSPQLALP